MMGETLLFLGPEVGEKSDALKALRERIKKTGGAAPEETSFYAGDTPVAEIVSVLLNGSLFSDARLILIKNADLIKKKNEIESIVSYIASAQDGTTLVLLSDASKIDGAIEKSVPANAKKIFWELFEEDKERWIINFFNKEGFKIERDAVDAILEMVENNTGALRGECSRIALFIKTENSSQKTITEEQILKLLTHSKQETAFSLFSALAKGERSKSYDILHSLLSAGEASAGIFGVLASSFRKLREYCFLAKNEKLNDFELKKSGINMRGKKDYSSARRIYGDGAADYFLSLSAEYDILSRSNSALADVIMDVYLHKIFSYSDKK